MSVTLFDLVGRSVEFRYPRHNLAVEGIPKRTESRHIRVDRVRDVESEPLDPMTLALSPLQRRGRYLITGYDDDRGAERSFYFESMQDVRVIDSPRNVPSEENMEFFHEGHRAGLCDAAKSREPFGNISVSSGVFTHGGEMEVSMEGATVQIVEVPRDWVPQSPHDMPPGFERIECKNTEEAKAVACGFNESELKNPKGWWAIH